VSQDKKLADYTSGTYFIHPKLIEEMRQAQRQKRQLARKQGEIPTEQQHSLSPVSALDPAAGEQPTLPITPDLAGPQSSHGHVNIAHIQPTQN
jgi:hypothetical protein